MTIKGPEDPDPATPAKTLIPFEHRVERAAGDFRRGAPVLIGDMEGESGLIVAAETVNDGTLHVLVRSFGAPSLILTHARASTLKIRLYTADVVSIRLEKDSRAMDIRAIADPATDLDNPLGTVRCIARSHSAAASLAVRLAKLAGLLPAALLFRLTANLRERFGARRGLSEVSVSDIARFEESTAQTLALVVRASVPLEGSEDAELVAFRPADGGQEHYAILIGSKGSAQLAPPGPVLTRLHSECFTGDLLGSLKCDCGDQLRGAVQAIAKAGGGVLLLSRARRARHRLMNKLRAYRLQDEVSTR
jgi:GTP cyclohydrolase II